MGEYDHMCFGPSGALHRNKICSRRVCAFLLFPSSIFRSSPIYSSTYSVRSKLFGISSPPIVRGIYCSVSSCSAVVSFFFGTEVSMVHIMLSSA